MQLGRIILASLMFGSAQAAGATVCSEVSQLVDEAHDNFRSIRGAYDAGLEEYAATRMLPGADQCTIEEDQYDAQYRCQWPFAGGDEASARSASASLTSDVRECFPQAGTRDFQYARYRSQSRQFKLDDGISVQVGMRYHESPGRSQFNRWIVDLRIKVEKP